MSDERQRDARANRIMWLSANQFEPGAVMGPAEALALRSEARYSFINGHFIGAVLLAMAFVEQTLVTELLDRDLTNDVELRASDALKLAAAHAVFDDNMLARAKQMADRRNAYAHLKSPEHKQSFAYRFFAAQTHPDLIREQDAKDALVLMDDYFRATLKAGDQEDWTG